MSDESPFVQAERWAKALTEPLIAHPLVYTAQRWWLDKQLISLEIRPNLGGGGSLLYVIEEEQADFSWEQDSRSKPGTGELSKDWFEQLAFPR